MRQIDSQQQNGGGAIPLLQNRIADPLFSVYALIFELIVTLVNANAADQTVTAEAFCKACKIDLFYRDGRPWLVNMDLFAVELLEQAETNGNLKPFSECVDRVITASSTETHTFRLCLRLRDEFAKDPDTYVQSLSNIGTAVVTFGATGNTNVTIGTSKVNVHVVGQRKGHVAVGARKVHAVKQAILGTEQQLALGGASLLRLVPFTYDNSSTHIVAMTGPKVKVDNQPAIVDEPLRNVAALDAIRGSFGESRMTAEGTPQTDRSFTRAAMLVACPSGHSISDLPRGEFIDLQYATQPCVTAGKQAYLLSAVIDNPRDASRQIIPGFAGKTDRQLAQSTVTRLASAGVPEPETEARLPYKVYPDALRGAEAA